MGDFVEDAIRKLQPKYTQGPRVTLVSGPTPCTRDRELQVKITGYSDIGSMYDEKGKLIFPPKSQQKK